MTRPVGRVIRSYSGVSSRFISTVNSLLQPIQYLLLDPANPILAQPDPLRELACRLKAGYMLW